MPTHQGTDTDEGTDAETSEETPDTDTDTHNPPQPIDPATHGDTDGEDASTDSDGTEGGSETSTATAGTNTNTDNADQQDSDQDNTNTAPAPPVDPNAETEGESGIDQDGDPDESVDQGTEAEGANIEVDGAEGAGGTDSTAPEPDAGAVIDGPNPMPMPQPNSPGAVSISGTATEDQTLTATVTDTDTLPDATNIRYQWQRDTGADSAFENIDNATSPTYTLGDADVGRNIRVVVNYTDGRGTDESPTSDATTTVTNINDDPNGSVSIDGTAEEDQRLTANTTALQDADGLPTVADAFTYQWQRNTGANDAFENIENATSPTYTLGDTDVGQTLRVLVNYIDGNNTVEALTSAPTTAVANINDKPSGLVIIDGTVREDQTLTANTDTLADADALPADAEGYRYQWQSNTGANGGFENIENATSETYTLGDADVGREVQVMVSYTDDGGMDESLTSTSTAAVENVNDDPSGSVSIDGTVEEDQTLTADIRALQDADGLPTLADAFTYQWQRNTGANDAFENIAGETGNTYTLDDADVGREVQVMVSYTDDGGMDETLTSAPTTAVININDEPTGSVSIDGTATEDETLTANTDTLADADALPADADGYRYQWQRSNESNGFDNIPTATSQSYNLGDADVGREVRVQASYTDGNSTPESLTSDATNAVTNINDAPSGSVTIDGTATEDETLTANTDNLADADGLGTLNYQWQSNTGANGAFENIENATSQTYILGDNDVGREVQVMVSYTDDGGMDESLTSAATTAVANINDDPTGAVTISGQATEDQTLTAQTDILADDDGLGTLNYQWQRSDGSGDFENIANATGETYSLGDADLGRNIRVVVNYTDGRGTDESSTSDATTTVTNINDDPSGSVSIDGTAEEDQTLTANITALQDADGLPTVADAFTYQWQRNTGANGGFENIAGETGNTYTLDDADVGREVQVQVSYRDQRGADERLISDATPTVTNINDEPTGSVTIDGTVEEDQILTANVDNVTDADGLDTFSYQWQRSDGSGGYTNIQDASGENYTLGDADVGREVRVEVRYTDGNNTAETVTSDATNAVTNINDAPNGAVIIDGTVEEDQTLTANITALQDADGLPIEADAFTYQWQRNTGANDAFEDIAGETGNTYTLDDADVGREVQVMVSYTDDGGMDESLTSAATTAVTNVNDAPTGTVTIDGQATENATLTANTGTLDDADGLGALSYQWQRSNDSGDFENIENATSETYTLGDDDVGREVRVVVSYTDDRGMDEPLTSAPTAAVGEDILTGTAGNDSDLQGGAGRQTINGLGGDDTLTGGAGDDVFRFAAGAGSDRITDFGTGDDRLLFEDGLFANLAAVQAAATESGDNLEIALSDTETLTLVGASLNDLSANTVTTLGADGFDTTNTEIVNGTAFAERLTAGAGSQRLNGLGGDDRLEGGAGADIIDGGAGFDWADYSSDFTGIEINLETGIGKGGDAEGDVLISIENVSGGSGDDQITGNTANNQLLGQNGNDTLDGGAGNDVLNTSAGDDTLIGGAGIDLLNAGTGDDEVMGGDGNDTLDGSFGNDMLNGGSGNDVLVGGAGDDDLNGGDGNDIMRGDAGADRFLFTGAAEGDDRIFDFDPLADRLVFNEDEWGDAEDALANLIQASTVDDDDDLLITRPDNGGTITLQGTYTEQQISAVLTDTSVSLIDKETLMDLAASEGSTPPPEGSEPGPSAGENSLSADSANKTLALADPLEPPPTLALFDADLEGYAGL